jgi:predicted NodU family carbamoyl transferase
MPKHHRGPALAGDAAKDERQDQVSGVLSGRSRPASLAEHAHEIFEVREGEESPYMLQVAPVREALRTPLTDEQRSCMTDPDLRIRVNVPRSTLPAITHVDYSARLQTVDPGRHDRFYRLMKEFQKLSGCPVVVNTSFNIRGEPIVCTPEDAYRCFLATDMDCLDSGEPCAAQGSADRSRCCRTSIATVADTPKRRIEEG